jgi:hypothetical protein
MNEVRILVRDTDLGLPVSRWGLGVLPTAFFTLLPKGLGLARICNRGHIRAMTILRAMTIRKPLS